MILITFSLVAVTLVLIGVLIGLFINGPKHEYNGTYPINNKLYQIEIEQQKKCVEIGSRFHENLDRELNDAVRFTQELINIGL